MIKSTFITLLLLFSLSLSAQLRLSHLRCEYKKNPIAIDELQPRLSWQIKVNKMDKNIKQTAYRLQVVKDVADFSKDEVLLWDTGKKQSDQSIQIPYAGKNLQSRERVFWRVKIWDNKGRESDWSKINFWEMALLHPTDWQAKWIRADIQEAPKALNPSPMFRKVFTTKNKIAKARLYITSHGLYEAKINGQNIGNQLFTPGWTSYSKRLQYQVYDVKDLLNNGANCIGVTLGNGWYRGEFGFSGQWDFYGSTLSLFSQLEIEYRDGTKEIISSDQSWKATTGPILMSSIYDGERYDARLEMPNWTKPNFDDSSWKNCLLAENKNKAKLIASFAPAVKKINRLHVKTMLKTPKGEQVLDFGQNLVGWVAFKVRAKRGDTLTLSHAEVLDKEGNFYTANLRSADQKIQYICKSDQQETYEPHFTFQGFRYVRIEGFGTDVKPSDFEAVVLHSNMERTGSFSCSDSLVNQLQSNIIWGQKGNFLDVPTDCPQRDERMGWTGDAQAFAPTACFNFQTASFYTKWLADLAADQKENGAVPFVIPNVLGKNAAGSTGWGDAATIVPWVLYQKYGDKRILEKQYASMKSWVAYLHDLAGENLLVQDGFHFGDWLFFIHPTDWNAKPGYSDIDFLATAFFAHSTNLLQKAAQVLGKEKDAIQYANLFQKIKSAFQKEFVTRSGRISPHSQTAYTLALAFELLPKEMEEKALAYLIQDIEKRKYHLSTGFLGTPYLCPVLSKFGRDDIAYKLLLQKTYPSWLYPVTRGATTIWERWDGIKPDGSFQNTKMNSFNHYAYGAIGNWMYSTIGGIRMDSQIPAYKKCYIAPVIGEGLSEAKVSFESMYGLIESSWKLKDGHVHIMLTIPPNTSATVVLPNHSEEGKEIELGSGEYEFDYEQV